MTPTLTLAEPFRALFYAPYYLTEARGAYGRQGLKVRMKTAGSTSLAAEAVSLGKADVAWSGPMRVMQHRAEDPTTPLTAFCAVIMRDPFLIVGRSEREGLHLAELPGMRLGLVTEVPTPVWCLAEAVSRAGGQKIKDRSGASMTQNLARLMQGTLDAIQVFEPFAAEAEAKGAHVWYAQAEAGPMAYSSLYARQDTLTERREAMRGLVRALSETLGWLAEAGAAEVAALLEPYFPEVPPEILTRAVGRYQEIGIWRDGPRFPRAAFEALGAAMLRAKALPHVPAFELCVDEAVVEEALA
ncbi:ABC transporter substrate-binding protein [Roseococcus pinisoli]|uniref:ABC transporter substrate-binding protein n=1 Tax=Roseococcus pinisoli TaxID=2835040 RepID=A0ABS5QJ95_9PROT|nr:ABC transporter substrate-binding protein [Roseococcus pinisoli]MBS7812598.1 ABC transporter substrate-binding protein [Roseococcus pinisoli]